MTVFIFLCQEDQDQKVVNFLCNPVRVGWNKQGACLDLGLNCFDWMCNYYDWGKTVPFFSTEGKRRVNYLMPHSKIR